VNTESSVTTEPAGRPPVPIRPAATVAILRDGHPRTMGIDVWLMRRQPTMAFAAGNYVFPGGAVDPPDADPELAWSTDGVAEVAGVFGVDEPFARSLVSAAVRETFEECGVLFGSPAHGPSRTADAAEAARVALLDGSASWLQTVREADVTLRADLLVPWSRWITPAWSPRRFDAYFFLAALPEGQEPRWVGGEADQAAWSSARVAVAAHEAGAVPMLPPTIAVLREIADADTVADLFAAAPARIRAEEG
jgi:8-oxo-dGTP pyrophosphatase MutT (NUDIX family)